MSEKKKSTGNVFYSGIGSVVLLCPPLHNLSVLSLEQKAAHGLCFCSLCLYVAFLVFIPMDETFLQLSLDCSAKLRALCRTSVYL